MARKKKVTAPSLDELALEFVQLDPGDAAAVARFAETVQLAAEAAEGSARAALTVVAARLRSVAKGDSADATADVNEAGLLLEAAMSPETEPAPPLAAGTGLTAGLVPDRLPADFDPDLVSSYAAEALEYLEGAEAALLLLEQSPDDAESVNTVFRAFHTLKGTSAFLGLERTTDLAHRAESLLSPVRDRLVRMDERITDLALRSIDVLKTLTRGVQGARVGSDIPLPPAYGELLRCLATGEEEIGEEEAQAIFAAAAAQRQQTRAQEPAGGPVRPAVTSPAADVVPPRAAGEAMGDTWVRVRTDRLDQLVDTIGELVIAETMIAQDAGVKVDPELAKKVSQAGKIVRELQDLSIAMRMVPLKSTFQKLTRLVRDLSRKSGKKVELVTEGEDTEIDRNMVENINDPLIHMIRNAMDHGLESVEERLAAGKARSGTIRLSAYHSGGEVVVELADDGRGLDRTKILAKALERGLVEPDRHLSDREICNLIFEPGFSTAARVTDVSGRGVGMDVVRRNVEAMRGRVDISSVLGAGTTFCVHFPLTLAITDGMLIRVGGERYIMPTASIHLSFRPDASALSTVTGRGEVVLLRDELMPIVRLHRVLEIEGAREDATQALLVVVGHGEKRVALMVDELLGQQQVVAKSLGETIGKIRGVSGGAILGDGRVGLILDVGELLALAQGEDGPKTRRAGSAQAA